MKIRQGFVSNSSSSSFCILGFEATNEEYDKVDAVPYKERTDTTLNTECGISNDEWKLIGYNPSKMREDETLSQFKDRIVTEAAKLGITVTKDKIDWFTDGGYNG
jgi:hypothetical protein